MDHTLFRRSLLVSPFARILGKISKLRQRPGVEHLVKSWIRLWEEWKQHLHGQGLGCSVSGVRLQ